jgi:hypothetical protein
MANRAGLLVLIFLSVTAATAFTGCAVMMVAGGSGGPGLAAPIAAFVNLAYLPALLFGVPRERWFYPDLLTPFLINVAVWTLVGLGLGAVLWSRVIRGTRTAAEQQDEADKATHR